MKNSGVAWIGMIPQGWKVVRGKDMLLERNKRSKHGIEELLSVSTYTGVRPRREMLDSEEAISRADSLVDYKVCFQGDIVINTMLAWNGSIGLSNYAGIVSPAYAVYQLRKGVEARFVEYLLRSDATLIKIRAESRGINDARLRLYPDNLFAIQFGIPTLPEQLAIADYLDRQTALIDQRLATLAEKKAVLAELRKATIHEAVTKGSTWNAETGQVENLPSGWVMLRIKDVAKLRSGDFIAAEKIEPSGVFPVYGGNGLRGYTDSFTHCGTFALVGRQGALCGNVNYATGKFWATEHAVVVRHKRKIVTRWLGEMLRCMNLNQYATASAQPGLSVEVIVNKFLPFPPLDEQQTIADHLDQQTQQFDAQLATLDEQARVLKELRKAIIHEAVTGKIDLSDYMPPPQALAA